MKKWFRKNGAYEDHLRLAEPGWRYGCGNGERIGKIKDDRIREVIRLAGLDPDDKKRVGKFSLGMRQRLGIAQAVMEDPALLVLDEPMNGLDKDGVEDMRRLFKELREEGKTILLCSHNAEDITVLCDEVYEIEKGVISQVEKESVSK